MKKRMLPWKKVVFGDLIWGYVYNELSIPIDGVTVNITWEEGSQTKTTPHGRYGVGAKNDNTGHYQIGVPHSVEEFTLTARKDLGDGT